MTQKDSSMVATIQNSILCKCGKDIDPRRYELGYNTCPSCGDILAQETRQGWTVAPIAHKQGYTRITNTKELQQLNKQ